MSGDLGFTSGVDEPQPVAAGGLLGALRAAVRAPIPRGMRSELVIDALVVALFLLQALTGILLSLYYQASPVTVGESVRFLMRDVNSGWLIRGVHHWSSHALILLAAARLVWIFWRGSYRGGNAATWYLGLFLLALLVWAASSGDVLTWDDQAYWRTRRLLEGIEAWPLVGAWLADVVRGGPEVSGTTLTRTYSAHSLFVPWLVWLSLVAHAFLLVQRVKLARRRAA